MPIQIQLRRGTSNQWNSANPILAEGEMGFETDTQKIKVGNGVATWTNLPYALSPVAGPQGPMGPEGTPRQIIYTLIFGG